MKEVLYVEDSIMSQRVMQRFLVGVCQLRTCSDLSTAETLLRESHVDLLITDFLFPQGDAMPLIRSVRRRCSTTDLPIIVVSSTLDKLLISSLSRANVNDYFAKPIKVAEFRSAVEKMLTSPYVRPNEQTTVGVRCFLWEAAGCFHQFSPELNLTVSGLTEEEVSDRMKAALQEQAEQGMLLGSIYHESILTHTVRPRVECKTE